MNPQITDLDAVTDFLQLKVNLEQSYIAKMQAAIAEDNLAYFMRWNGIDMMGAVYQAKEARRYLDYINREAEGNPDKFDVIFRDVTKRVTKRVTKTDCLNISRRGSSLAANLEEDFCMSFILEFNNRLQEGWT